jgi:hypothetical protein
LYLTDIWLDQTGPIDKCHVALPFSPEAKPIPIVLVGPNGAGKSIFLSYVADALFEFGKPVFRDFVSKDFENQSPYFRLVGPTSVRTGCAYSLALLKFKDNEKMFGYVEKAGPLDPQTYSPSIRSTFEALWNWPNEGHHKSVISDQKLIEAIFSKEALCYFPASRREIPSWLHMGGIRDQLNFSTRNRFQGVLGKPLYIETSAPDNLSWLLDIFLDSQIDFEKLQALAPAREQDGVDNSKKVDPSPALVDARTRIILARSRKNVERILQEILQDPKAELVLNLRHVAPSRLAIRMGDGRLLPSLDSLSAGQSVLFNMFVTIIRYADRGDINLSLRLHDIHGIVIIDEIDAHLHTGLQHDCLPRLLKLFPGIQFIVASHAPLFLLGMEKAFGHDGFHIIEMPTGERIMSERYAEFENSFECYRDTKRFDEEIKRRISEKQKPLVLTEGQLDPIYVRTALKLLGEDHLDESIDIEFVGIDDDKGGRHGGKDGLNHFRNVCEANPWLAQRKVLLLYDFDSNKPDETFGNIYVRTIPKSTFASKADAGIENLFPNELFEDRFYKKQIKEGKFGAKNTIIDFDKREFCKWLCEDRKNPEDFKAFKAVIAILRDFFATAA